MHGYFTIRVETQRTDSDSWINISFSERGFVARPWKMIAILIGRVGREGHIA